MNARVTYNKDGTITVRVGRAVEHLTVDGKTKAQVFDAVKYALISKGIRLSDVAIAELIAQTAPVA